MVFSSGGELQAAVFELCGFYVAVCKVLGVEGLLVGALCEVEVVKAEELKRRRYAEEIINRDFKDQVQQIEEGSDGIQNQQQHQHHIQNCSLDRLEAIPGFAPQDVRELAQEVLDRVERKIREKMGVERLRVLELKAEAMAEGIGEEVAGLRIPEGS